MLRTHIERPDLTDENSPGGLKVSQLTADSEIPYAHLYMEAQVFSPDSRQMLIERSGNAHTPVRDDKEHRYMLINLDQKDELIPITDELNAIAPSFSPDGSYIYYLVDQAHPEKGGKVILKRVRPDGTGRETLLEVDGPIEGSDCCPCTLYALSTISSDGKRFSTCGYVGMNDQGTEDWGILCFDLEKPEVKVSRRDPYIKNAHPQYCRSTDPQESHDIMVQHNHGFRWNPATGNEIYRPRPTDIDIHVFSDDGGNFRSMPWGRGKQELAQGHQCWRGRTHWAITSTGTVYPDREDPNRFARQHLIESLPVTDAGHKGKNTPGAIRNFLCRSHDEPHFHHFCTGINGERLITDYRQEKDEGVVQTYVYHAHLGQPGKDAGQDFKYLLDTKASFTKATHAHPFISPDGRRAFFNSDESGNLQTYMIEGLENL